MPSVPFTDSRWSVLNPPEKDISISPDGSTLKMVSNPESDLYRTPKWEKYNASVYGFKQTLGEKGLTVSVDVELDYKDLYDQAGLYFHISNTLWFKFGLELEGDLFAGTVVTQPYSDWSLVPAKSHVPKRFTFTLHDKILKIYNDGVMAREVNCFGTGDETEAFVGVMTCSPKGGGRTATFSDFRIDEGVIEPKK